MMNFCTLFDSNYIYKGIALYLSLEKITNDFNLFVMAFDRNSYDLLKAIGFKHMTVELWDEWETAEIKAVKEGRNRAEYCWTCGPTVIHHFLTCYHLSDITYLDSDLFFIGNPQLAFDEIGNASVAITEQGISPKAEKLYGKYCVQFMFFRKDKDGMGALEWWRDACIDWCYQRFEDDKFGDQKYLDQFPKRFDNVYVVKNPGVGVAPWNMNRYKYDKNGSTIVIDDNEYPVVFFHMHGLKGVVKGDSLLLESSAIIYDKVKAYFFESYGELMQVVFNVYLGVKIKEVIIKGQSKWRWFELFLRGKLNKIAVLRNLYYKIFGQKEHSAGAKF